MVVINICVGSACYVKGSHDIINRLKDLIKNNDLQNEVELKAAFCLNHCTDAVCAMVDSELYSLDTTNVDEFFNKTIKEKIELCK